MMKMMQFTTVKMRSITKKRLAYTAQIDPIFLGALNHPKKPMLKNMSQMGIFPQVVGEKQYILYIYNKLLKKKSGMRPPQVRPFGGMTSGKYSLSLLVGGTTMVMWSITIRPNICSTHPTRAHNKKALLILLYKPLFSVTLGWGLMVRPRAIQC